MVNAADTPTLDRLARAALVCASSEEKLERVADTAQRLARDEVEVRGDFRPDPPDEPGRPARPVLVAPREVSKRSAAAGEAHAALIHAMAHIEFNAIKIVLNECYS